MKTAISIPDELFTKADRLAKRLGLSRSELYARAVRSFVDRIQDDRLSEELNSVYSEIDSSMDPVLARIQSISIDDGGW